MVPEEVLLGGTSTDLVNEDLYGVWLPRRQLKSSEHFVQCTPETQKKMSAVPQGADLAQFARETNAYSKPIPTQTPPVAPVPLSSTQGEITGQVSAGIGSSGTDKA